jgi:fructose-1,6-bisphosphatase class II
MIERELSLWFLRVVEEAAIEAAKTMGMGDRELADRAAVEAMRRVMDTVPMNGTVVIGEGERDEAPMLFIGEKVGRGSEESPEVDIAVDPLEGTNLCATGAANAITVIAASEKGGLLHAPDCYMEKIIVGPEGRGAMDLDAPVKDNLRRLARHLDREVKDLVVVVLERPRHQKLIADIRAAGARIRLIGDGDLSAGISAAVHGTGVHAVMGSGGAPEGVLTAAALRCLNGDMLARLVIDTPELRERVQQMGIRDPEMVFTSKELAPGRHLLFAATGVTDGNLLRGVRFFGDGIRTHSLVLTQAAGKVRFVDSIHLDRRSEVSIRL